MMVAGNTASGVGSMSLSCLLDRPDCVGGDTIITGLQLDSRKVCGGDLFLALPGDVHDGRQFIEQAVANGAAAVLAEAPVAGFVDELPVPLVEIPELRLEAGALAARFFGFPSRDLHTVGVTGTNGKTTTSRLVAQLGRSLGKTCGVIGTLGATLDESVSESANTTPDAVSLQRQLADWRDQGVTTISMEVSSHALVQGRVSGVEFETAIYTNLSHDHLDYHGSMDEYGRAKLQLFASEGLRHAVVNIDDEYARQVLATIGEGVRVLTYSASGAEADIRVLETRFHEAGVDGELVTPWGTGRFTSPLPGEFNLANLAAAVTAVVLSGEDLASVLQVVSGLQPVPGRMQAIPNDQGLQVIIDYAHTPDALEQVLTSLKAHVSGDLIVVFGCGGDRDNAKRQVMGRVASQLADRVFVTSDNPRSEDPAAILADIASGCSGNFVLVVDRDEAIFRSIAEARRGDCVVVAGKGHEDYQLVEGERRPFSDAAHARDALARRVAS